MKTLFYFITTAFVGALLTLVVSKSGQAANYKEKLEVSFVNNSQVAQDSTVVVVVYIRQEEYKKNNQTSTSKSKSATTEEKQKQDKENKSYQVPSYQIEKPNIIQAITNWLFRVLESILLPNLIK